MSKLTICANIFAKQGSVEFVKTELIKLIAATRAEAGCINYDLHQDNDNPTHFFFYENWNSRDHWQAHMEAQHLKDYLIATEDAIDRIDINEMTPIA